MYTSGLEKFRGCSKLEDLRVEGGLRGGCFVPVVEFWTPWGPTALLSFSFPGDTKASALTALLAKVSERNDIFRAGVLSNLRNPKAFPTLAAPVLS